MEKKRDYEIVELCQKGEKVGFSYLVGKYWDYFINVTKYGFFISETIAPELVNDSFLKAIQNIDKFKFTDKNSLKRWLYTILKNTILDHLDKIKNEDEKLSFCYYNENDFENYDDPLNNVNPQILKKIKELYIEDEENKENEKVEKRKKLIYDTIEELTDDEKLALLDYLNQVPHAEIARRRNSNEISTRKFINRLIKKFFEKIGQKLNLDGKKLYEKFKTQNQ